MSTPMIRSLILTPLALLLFFVAIPTSVHALELQITPPLLDLELEPRAISTHEVTITNTAPNKVYVYATVNEIAVNEDGTRKEFISPVMDDREASVTSWVEVTRGRIELLPGETTTVPVTVRVHPYAKTGTYHAFLGFIVEANRPLAEAKALRGDGEGVILKVALEERGSDSLRIVSFLINRFIVTEKARTVILELKNEGTKVSTPSGEIIFYNSRGEETGSVPVNPEGLTLAAGETKEILTTVPFFDRLGRFKANVTVRYGAEGKDSIFDTTQFYMIPPRFVIIASIFIILFSLFVTYLLRKVFYDELQSDDEDGKQVPLFVRQGKEHIEHDHDIRIEKK